MIRVITWTKRIRWLLKKIVALFGPFSFCIFPIAAMVFASWEILTHSTEMNQLLYIIVMTKGRKVYDFFILWMVVISNCWVVPSVLLYQIDRYTIWKPQYCEIFLISVRKFLYGLKIGFEIFFLLLKRRIILFIFNRTWKKYGLIEKLRQ